jgi:hypothetical protein
VSVTTCDSTATASRALFTGRSLAAGFDNSIVFTITQISDAQVARSKESKTLILSADMRAALATSAGVTTDDVTVPATTQGEQTTQGTASSAAFSAPSMALAAITAVLAFFAL